MKLIRTLLDRWHQFQKRYLQVFDKRLVAYDEIQWHQARQGDPSHPEALRRTNEIMRELTWQDYTRARGAQIVLTVEVTNIDTLVVLLNGIPKTITLKESIDLKDLTPAPLTQRFDRFLRTNDGHSIPVQVAFERFSQTLEWTLNALYEVSMTDELLARHYLRSTQPFRTQCAAVQAAFIAASDQQTARFN